MNYFSHETRLDQIANLKHTNTSKNSTGGQKEIVVMPDGIDDDEEKEEDKVEKDDEDDEKEDKEKSGKRFDGIIQYIGTGDWMDMCAAGPSTSAAAGIY
jgi:hypothetical protein